VQGDEMAERAGEGGIERQRSAERHDCALVGVPDPL
jgi:hypothetical protein